MNKRSINLIATTLVLFTSNYAWAISAGDASDAWDFIDKAGSGALDQPPGHGINAVFPDRQECFDRSGNKVSESSGLPRLRAKNSTLTNCDAVVDFLEHEENRNDSLNGKRGEYGSSCNQDQACLEKLIKDLKDERDNPSTFLIEVIPNRMAERKKALDVAITSLTKRVSVVQQKISDAPRLQTKQKSRECRLYRLMDGLCTQTVMVDNANQRLKAEDGVTSESGIIDKRERYNAGQQKLAFSRNLNSNLAEYKKLIGKPFDKKGCDQETEQDKSTEIQAEIKACGCSNLDDGVNESPSPCP